MSNLLTVFLSVSLFFFFLFLVVGLFLFFPACCISSFAFFFLFDFSSRVLLDFEVLHSVSDSLFGCFFHRLGSKPCHVGHSWLKAPNMNMLYSRDTTICIHICGNIINNNDERTLFFRKIYLSHFILERVVKVLCVRGELETEQTATY